MKFFVCINQVPDVNAPMRIQNGALIQDNSRNILNAYDASALEGALLLGEQYNGDVEVVLAGPENAGETIRKALAMGAAKGTHIIVEEPGFDSYVYAKILAAFFADKEYDYISCGKQSQDTDAGLAGPMLAGLLKVPYVSNAVALGYDEGALIVTRQGDSGQELIQLPSPGLVTCSNDMNEPRIPGLKGIMQSRKKPVDVIELHELIPQIGSEVIHSRVLGFEEKPVRQPGRKLEGDAEEIARQAARFLDSETGIL